VESAGLASVDQWRTLLERARVSGSFAGVAPSRYPRDLASFFGYQRALREIPARYPIPEPLPLAAFDTFFANNRHRYPELTLELVSTSG
jgi:hypothetical protein